MAYQIKILTVAHAETDVILSYLKKHSQASADKFYKDLHNCYDTLQAGIISYGLSRIDSLAKQGYHAVLFNKYVLLYFEEGNVRTIAHIFAQKQDYANLV